MMNHSQIDLWKICREKSTCLRLPPPPRPPTFPQWFHIDESTNRISSIFTIVSMILFSFLLILLAFRFFLYDKLRQRLCPSPSKSSTNATIYEEIPSISSDLHSSSHHYCLCPTVNPYYQIYETSSTHRVCENCLFAALNRHSNIFLYERNINNVRFK